MSNTKCPTSSEKQKSSGLLRGWQGLKTKTKQGQANLGSLAAEKGRTTRKVTQNPLLRDKTKEKEEKKKQGWFHLDSGQAEADEGSVQRVELPHPGRVIAGSGRRPGPANFPGSLLWLKCVGSMASLAVHSSA